VSKKLFWAILMATPAIAGEYAILSSGLRIHVERHEPGDGTFVLFTKEGSTEVPAESVSGFEADDYVAPPPARVAAAVVPVAAAAPRPVEPKVLLHDAAVKYALPPKFVESVAKVESALKQNAVSPKGAIGVMQLMPATAKALDADPNITEQNIDAGTHLLRELLIKYDGDVVKALAAYNAGTGAVDKYQGLPPYPETQTYVDRVITNYKKSGGQ
jgi:soluble lytic murein transglycosylase-like protein